MSSVYGSASVSPYALSLDATTTRCDEVGVHGGRPRAGSTCRGCSPRTSPCGCAMRRRRRSVCAPRWKTVSTSCSLTARSSVAEVLEPPVDDRDALQVAAADELGLRVEVADERDDVAPRREQLLDQPGADHPGRAGDEHAAALPRSSCSLPHLPRRLAALPQVARAGVRRAACPSAARTRRGGRPSSWPSSAEPLERLALQDRLVAVEVVEHAAARTRRSRR